MITNIWRGTLYPSSVEWRWVFPSSFMIMLHMSVHLANEALVGLVQYRWMYPFERYHYNVCSSFSRKHTFRNRHSIVITCSVNCIDICLNWNHIFCNKSRLEGSIVEGYLTKECVTSVSKFLNELEISLNRWIALFEQNKDSYVFLLFVSSCIVVWHADPLSPLGPRTLITIRLLSHLFLKRKLTWREGKWSVLKEMSHYERERRTKQTSFRFNGYEYY